MTGKSTWRPNSTATPANGVVSDEQFRQLASGLSQILWRTTPDGTRIIAPRWAEVAGCSEQDLQREGWLATIHADDRAAVRQAVLSSRAHGSLLKSEFRLRQRDGRFHWFRARGEPLRDPSGAIYAWVGMASNIDDQKSAEAAAAESQARLHLVIDAAEAGIFEHDLINGTIEANAHTREQLGLTPGAPFDFAAFTGCIHPDDIEGMQTAIGASRASDSGAYERVFRAVHPDGSIRWLSVRGRHLYVTEHGKRIPVRFMGVSTDLSLRVRELEERARLSAIVQSAGDAILAVSLAGRVTHWNHGAERVFGYTAAEMLGAELTRLAPAGLEGEVRAHLDAVMAGETISGVITQRVTKDGRRIQVSLTLSPMHSDAGRVIGLSAIIRDVTAQQRLEEQMREAQTMDAVSHLAGGIAHDLNNVLTSVLLGLEVAAQAPGHSEFAQQNIADLHDECFRAAGLVRQLLAVARRQVMSPRLCTLSEVVNRISPMLERVLGENVVLETSFASKQGLHADPAHLGQALINLASNARDAMPHGGRFLIQARDDASSNSVKLIVSDTGSGMSPEVKTHLFEPFFSTKGPGLGTGLGLSAVYGIVTQSAGTIAVDSETGRGTSFTISFPAVEPPASADASRDPIPEAGADETILVVEDEQSVRTPIVRCLRDLGYHVLEARNGVDALATLERYGRPIDLVLSDVMMPEMSGSELVTQLRDWYPGLRAIFMSGYSEDAVELHGVLVEGTTLLQKPFERSVLATRIRLALEAGPAVSGVLPASSPAD